MTDRGYIIAVVVWPFIFLAPYTLNSIAIGNDFSYLYYVYKVYLLSVWNTGPGPAPLRAFERHASERVG